MRPLSASKVCDEVRVLSDRNRMRPTLSPGYGTRSVASYVTTPGLFISDELVALR